MLPYPIASILLAFPLLLQGSNTTPDSGAQSGTLVAILVAVCVGVIDQLFKRYSGSRSPVQPVEEPSKPRHRRNDEDNEPFDDDDEDGAATVFRILQPQVTANKADISRIFEKLEDLEEMIRTEIQKPIKVDVTLNSKGDN